MDIVEPNLSILPKGQKTLWPELKEIPTRFVLYGGTALALQLGHRDSVDFDFFSDKSIERDQLLRLPFLQGAKIEKEARETLIVSIIREGQEIGVSFFGKLSFGRVAEPVLCKDNRLKLASIFDIAVQKVLVLHSRGAAKDYIDLAALIKNGISLEQACGGALALNPNFNYSISLAALSYFEDGDLVKVPNDIRQTLSRAAKNFQQPVEILKQSDLLCEEQVLKTKFNHSSKCRLS